MVPFNNCSHVSCVVVGAAGLGTAAAAATAGTWGATAAALALLI